MAKRKLKMELINDRRALLVTYNKRKANLLKKVSELSILCGIDACIVIVGPQLSRHQCVRPETWPSDPDEVKRIIQRFVQSDQHRRCSYVSDYFADKKKKIDSEIAELRKQNYKARYYSWHLVMDSLSEDQLRAFGIQLNGKLELAVKRLQMLKQNQLQKVELTARDRSQLGHDHSNGFFTNLLVFGGSRSSDSQTPAFRFYPESAQSNLNLVDRNIDQNNGFATKLPFNAEPLQSFCRAPLTDDLMMNMLNNHSSGSLMNDEYIPQSGFSYASPISWMRNNDSMLYNSNSFMQQPVPPQFQLPMLQNTPYQVRSSQSNELNGNLELIEKGHEWKWRVD